MKNSPRMLTSIVTCAAAAVLLTGPALAETPSAFCGKIDPDNLTYRGIEELDVTLTNGAWEGEPYTDDSPVRPRVGRIPDFEVCGDLDGDGEDETVVALWFASGGSGTFQYLAVLEDNGLGPENTYTAPVGDRVKIEGGSISDGMLGLDVVQHGPDEPACCPTQAVTRYYDTALNLVKTTKRKTH